MRFVCAGVQFLIVSGSVRGRRWLVVGSAAAVVVLLMGLLIWHPWQSPNNSGTSASTTSAPVLPTVAAPPPFSTIAGPPPAPATSAPPAPDPLYALPACYDGRTVITVEPDTSNLFCRRHFYEDLKWTRWTASASALTWSNRSVSRPPA